MTAHRITRESGERLAKQRRQQRHQPPARFKNTRPVGATGSGGSGKLVYCETPTAGIPAMTKSGSQYAFGEATCTVVNADGNLTAETITVRNSVAELIPGEILIGVSPLRDASGKWGIVVGNCDQAGSS